MADPEGGQGAMAPPKPLAFFDITYITLTSLVVFMHSFLTSTMMQAYIHCTVFASDQALKLRVKLDAAADMAIITWPRRRVW